MTFDGLDLLTLLTVAAIVCGLVRQTRINRHDRERNQSRTAVKNILRATGRWS